MMDGDLSVSTGRTTAEKSGRRRVRTAAPAGSALSTRAEELRRLVKEIDAKPRPRLVHHLRTTIRRLETLMPAPTEAAPRVDQKVRAQLDRIRARAGKVRDIDVHLLALRGLAKGAPGEAREQLRADLRRQRAKREKRLVRAVAAERARGLLKRIRKVVRRTGVVGPQSDADRERVLDEVLERFDRALQAATPLGAENLHAFRLQTKRLRYLAETASPHAGAAVAVAQLKRVQDAIGAWHDWLTLAERAEHVVAGKGAAELRAAVSARIDAQLAKALKVTTSVARRLSALRPTGVRRGTRPMTSASVAALRSTRASA